ncbi:MAG TPA: hypothetical protein EYP68_08570 [Candidatus Korarchaeota archaeon]|nr:hypothetical protein [Candidatus Korarchaeota archaeon]
MGRKYVPLWALLPALKNREVAKRILSRRKDLTEEQIKYLRDTIEQGDRVERRLRELGYFDEGPRGKLLRLKGIAVDTDEEAEEILKSMERERDRGKGTKKREGG